MKRLISDGDPMVNLIFYPCGGVQSCAKDYDPLVIQTGLRKISAMYKLYLFRGTDPTNKYLHII